MILKLFSGNYLFKLVSLITLIILLASCGAGKTGLSRKGSTTALQKDVLDFSKKHLGKPYRYSGKGPNSFDCSGFTSYVFREFGFRLNSSSAGQDKQFPSITSKDKLRKGDLVFFEGNRKNGSVGHVGIVTETYPNGEFRFIHASTTSGVIISSSTEPYYASRYLRGGRVLKENSYQEDVKRNVVVSEELAPKQLNPAIITVAQTDPSKNPELLTQQGHSKKREQKDKLPIVKSDVILREENALVPTPFETHVVQPGETLYSISKRYGCSVEEIKKWNPYLDSILKAGDKLNILPGIN
jgi:lipoprotein Spr